MAQPLPERLDLIVTKLLTKLAPAGPALREARSYRRKASQGAYQKDYSQRQRSTLKDLKKANPEAYAKLLAEVRKERT